MADTYLGDVRLMSFGAVPKGWAPCNGQRLPINSNRALFALFGNRFGGDGRSDFALPTLAAVPAQNGATLDYRICIDGWFPSE